MQKGGKPTPVRKAPKSAPPPKKKPLYEESDDDDFDSEEEVGNCSCYNVHYIQPTFYKHLLEYCEGLISINSQEYLCDVASHKNF